MTAHAIQTASTTTKASGSTKGGTAGIGLSLALEAPTTSSTRQLERNLTAAGAVSFTADGSSTNDTEATASSAGAKGKSGSGTADGDRDGEVTVKDKAD